MIKQLSKKAALALGESKFWESLSFEQRARFQLYQNLLCMPFDVFHEAVEKTLGRPVWTHEFANQKSLQKELEGLKKAPTFDEIMNLLPRNILIIMNEQSKKHVND